MSIYKIEGGRGPQGQTIFTPGDLLPAQVYTDTLPSSVSVTKFPDRLMPFKKDHPKGYVVRGLLEFTNRGVALFNIDPEQAIREIDELKQALVAQDVDADAKFNVLNNIEKVEIPEDHMKIRGGLRILTPYMGLEQSTALLIVAGPIYRVT